jgi:hypothetical protein
MYLFVFCELEQGKILIYKKETCKFMLGNFETGPGPIDPRISWVQLYFCYGKAAVASCQVRNIFTRTFTLRERLVFLMTMSCTAIFMCLGLVVQLLVLLRTTQWGL